MTKRGRKKGHSDRKIYGGRLYYMYDAHKKKRDAKRQAEKLRTEGWLARVVYYDERWVVYRRKK